MLVVLVLVVLVLVVLVLSLVLSLVLVVCSVKTRQKASMHNLVVVHYTLCTVL